MRFLVLIILIILGAAMVFALASADPIFIIFGIIILVMAALSGIKKGK